MKRNRGPTVRVTHVKKPWARSPVAQSTRKHARGTRKQPLGLWPRMWPTVYVNKVTVHVNGAIWRNEQDK